jgi:hypothetical protein
MACQTFNVEGMGTVHVCGLPAPKRCAFCGGKAPYLCDFKVNRAVSILASDVRRGDFIRWYNKADREVIFRDASPDGSLVYLAVKDEKGKVLQLRYMENQTFKILRLATCDNPCCDTCAREPDENVHHCKDHWNVIEIGVATR